MLELIKKKDIDRAIVAAAATMASKDYVSPCFRALNADLGKVKFNKSMHGLDLWMRWKRIWCLLRGLSCRGI